jgi:hypothetical protein
MPNSPNKNHTADPRLEAQLKALAQRQIDQDLNNRKNDENFLLQMKL